MKSIFRISVLKTLRLTARYGGVILVYRGTRLDIERGAKIQMDPGAHLILGQKNISAMPTSLSMKRNSRFTVKGEVRISRGARIQVSEGASLEIGDGFYMNFDATIICWDRINIGADAGISWSTNILDGNAHELVVGGVPRPRTRPVWIGDRAWIGAGAIVIGTTIGDGAVVAAGSVVTSEVPPKVLVGGNPARVLREDVTWKV
jgi:acetyltransferase-like isoleucine patch superfamily enzyme